ncbi:MAG: phosphopyruvate hydratase [Bdellovibrionales bacterium GWB1_55_8]|nr:MAG: phosphopyruvate hydratase [Bdellovibrionales bacterium GWB1_55_8]
MLKIRKVVAREVLDSRGFPTVEAEVTLDHPKHAGELVVGRAMVPSGASTGEGEALELRDGDKKRYLGKGVLNAVANIREKIAPAITGREFSLQSHLDDALREIDGTPNKTKLGANAILGVSMAFSRAQALAQGETSYRLLSSTFGSTGVTLPVPLMNIVNGGKHADNGLAIQEFMIVPAGFDKFSEALRAGVEVFHRLKKILSEKKLSTGVGDEGGFAPVFDDEHPHEQALLSIMQAIRDAGYKPGTDIFLALDCAASEFTDGKGGYMFEGTRRTSEDMINVYSGWVDQFPIVSIEDGLSEHDWEGWASLTQKLGSRIQLVGDDLFVTNPKFLKRGIESKVANAILIKLNQIGTVTETLETMKMAAQAGYNAVVSHRSGETEDSFIADLAVATDCGQIKTGSASRTDRIAKYNQLLRIEEQLGSNSRFSGMRLYERFRR